MKIQYIKGDLFSTDIDIIVHGCNDQGVMGSGVAKVVIDRFTHAYDVYRQTYLQNNKLTLGEIIPVRAHDGNISGRFKTIVNAITQRGYGRSGDKFVSYDAVDDCMIAVNAWCKNNKQAQVAMPQIGAGLGGGNWDVIQSIIQHRLSEVQPVVYVL